MSKNPDIALSCVLSELFRCGREGRHRAEGAPRIAEHHLFTDSLEGSRE
jgi:hypothetical protein